MKRGVPFIVYLGTETHGEAPANAEFLYDKTVAFRDKTN